MKKTKEELDFLSDIDVKEYHYEFLKTTSMPISKRDKCYLDELNLK